MLLSIREQEWARWIAAMNPPFLWAPVADALDNSSWRVLNAQGQTLFSASEGAMPRPAAHTGSGATPADPADFRFRLFLRGAFGTPDWVFVQHTPCLRVVWQGWPLRLGLVAAATVVHRPVRAMADPAHPGSAGTTDPGCAQARRRRHRHSGGCAQR
ncbi:hypothetical protein THIX_20803 [Thiomonas sp. X19]|nr:hypothetical protein THIX_20803 [Thiomonas sp. X19]